MLGRLIYPMLILLLLSWARLTYTGCPISAFQLRASESRAIIRQACGDVDTVNNDVTCHFPEEFLCDQTEIMVLNISCVRDQWIWAVNAQFCPQWSSCQWIGYNLTCNGGGDFRAGSARTPNNLDPRLLHISFTHYPQLISVRHTTAPWIRNVRTLDYSNNSLRQVDTGALSAFSRLTSLSLFGNRLTYLSATKLPPFGQLAYLDLRNNEFGRPGLSPLALHAAMTTCDVEAEPRTLKMDGNTCSMSREGDCQFVRCHSDIQPLAPWPCPAVNDSVIFTHQLCNGVRDCIDGSDEVYCAGTYVLDDPQPDPGVQDWCDSISKDIGQTFRAHCGLLTLELIPGTDLYQTGTGNAVIFFSLAERHNAPAIDSSGTIRLNVSLLDDGTMMFLYFLTGVGVNRDCAATYSLAGIGTTSGSSSSTTFPPAWLQSSGSGRSAGPWIAAVAVGVVAVVAISLAFLLMRRRRQRPTLKQWSGTAMYSRAEQIFAERYSQQLGGAARCGQIYQQAQIRPQHVVLSEQVLGVGQFGVVVAGTFAGPPRHPAWTVLQTAGVPATVGKVRARPACQVAVKTVTQANDEALVQLMLEMRLLAAMPHPHIVRLLAVQEQALPLLLVMEYCELGNLRDYLRERANGGGEAVSVAAKQDFARQVADAVEYLHEKAVLHRDLAARNVLLTARGAEEINARGQPLSLSSTVAKLADLGLARALQTETDYYRSVTEGDVVPVRWQCPQAVATKVYTTKSDVYSFGVVLYEIFTDGARPFGELAASEVGAAVQAGQRLRFGMTTPMAVQELAHLCTSLVAAQRPTMAAVRQRLEAMVCFVSTSHSAATGGANFAKAGTAGADEEKAVVPALDFEEDEAGETAM